MAITKEISIVRGEINNFASFYLRGWIEPMYALHRPHCCLQMEGLSGSLVRSGGWVTIDCLQYFTRPLNTWPLATLQSEYLNTRIYKPKAMG